MSLLIDALKKTDQFERDSGFYFSPGSHEKRHYQRQQSRRVMYLAVVFLSAVIFAVCAYIHRHHAVLPPKVMPVVTVKAVSKPEKSAHASIVVVNKPYQDALALIGQGKYQAAVSLLEDNALAQSTQGESLVALATTYLLLGNDAAAEQVVRDGLAEKVGSQSQLTGVLGQILFQRKQYSAALATLETTSPSLEAQPEYYALMARTYIKLNQPEPAVALFKQLVAFEPDNAVWWLGLGVAYQEQGALSLASDSYGRALKLNTDPQVAVFLTKQRQLILGIEESH